MSTNQLSESIPSSLSSLTNLVKLVLHNNQLSGAIPSSLGSLTNLTTLHLANNQLSGDIPSSLCLLINLSGLYMWNNQLSGAIPSSLSSLTNLMELNLSNNQLSGVIPSSLGSLTNLIELNLSQNQLSGAFPSSLGSLNPQRLDISVNKDLRGIIRTKSWPRLNQVHFFRAGFTKLDIDPSVLSHLPPGSAVQCALTTSTKPQQLDAALSAERNLIHQACEPGHQGVLDLLQQLSSTSPWRFWIAAWYWLLGDESEDAEIWQAASFLEQVSSNDRQLMAAAISTWMKPAFHGNLLHLMALLDLQEEELPEFNIVSSWRRQSDWRGRTPLDVFTWQLRMKESTLSDQKLRCESYMRQQELAELMVQKGTQRRIQEDYKEGDQILQKQLRSTTRTKDTQGIAGSLLQVRHTLRQGQSDVRSTPIQLQRRCATWIKQAMMLNWSGHKREDQDTLRSVKQSFSRRRTILNTLQGSGNTNPQLLSSLCKELERYLCEESIRQLLEYECPQAYDQVIAWCRKRPKRPARGTWIHDVDLGSNLLTMEAAERLMPEGLLVKENQQGHHVVVAYQGMHFKCLQDSHAESGNLISALPGVEFMVDRLAKLVVGHGTAPSRLVKLTRGDRQLIMQVSRSVEGTTLDWVLQHFPGVVELVNRQNLADMTLISPLTNPQDGKADNYMVEIEYEENEAENEEEESTRQLKALHLVGIDNDMAFGDTVSSCSSFHDDHTDFVAQVRNVVYLLPAMDEPISPDSRDHFLALSPDVTLLAWLDILEERNVQYERMRKEGVFTTDDFEGDRRDPSDEGLQLPIRIPEGVVTRLYHNMDKIQHQLRMYPQSTLHQVFAQVEPGLAEMYQTFRHSGKPIVSQIQDLYEMSLRDQLEGRDPKEMNVSRTERSNLYSALIYQAQKVRSSRMKKLDLDDAIRELLTQVPKERRDVLLQNRRE